MQCNIDEKGAQFRRVWGILNVMGAAVLGGLAYWSGIWWLWIISGVTGAAGAFAIFEAHKKWCIIRSMGLKTRV